MKSVFKLTLVLAATATALPTVAMARGGSGGSRPQHSDLTITKTTDKSSPKMMQQSAPTQSVTANKAKGALRHQKSIDEYMRQ